MIAGRQRIEEEKSKERWIIARQVAFTVLKGFVGKHGPSKPEHLWVFPWEKEESKISDAERIRKYRKWDEMMKKKDGKR